MAIYKGREVTLQSTVPTGFVETQNVTIVYADGTTQQTPLNTISFTKKEKDTLQKEAGSKFDNVSVIEDNDLQDLKDGQNPDKIDMSKNPAPDSAIMKTQEVDSEGKPVNQAKAD